jgi:hypothetical protein
MKLVEDIVYRLDYERGKLDVILPSGKPDDRSRLDNQVHAARRRRNFASHLMILCPV